MERVVRFERELTDDVPDLRVGDPAGETYRHHITGTTLVDSDVNQMILFEDAALWRLQRFLVIEITQWHMRFIIEDRGRLPISNNCMQELKIQRHSKEVGIYDNHHTVQVPEGLDPHDIYVKIRLLETAPRELAQNTIWGIFWDLEIVPSYSKPHYWLRLYAPNFLEHLHKSITQERLDKIRKVMEA